MCGRSLYGNGEISRSADGHVVPQGPHREGEEPWPTMHGREKSDSAIVAAKPANKAERSAAESAEPRAGIKGNAVQQSMRRTLSRENVSQALKRIRRTTLRRQTPKVGAVCLNWARTDLSGGRSAMGVPTAIRITRRERRCGWPICLRWRKTSVPRSRVVCRQLQAW
jgi:hypothetical protein